MSIPRLPSLRIAFATGTSPQKWFRRFLERIPANLVTESTDSPRSLLDDHLTDMALIRTSSGDADFPEQWHRVHLYDEVWGVAFIKDHAFSLFTEVPEAELAAETMLLSSVDPAQLRDMLPVVATGAGIACGPQPILRELAKKEIKTASIVETDTEAGVEAPQSRSSIWLVWPKADDDELRQEFVGIVQGRRAGSLRSYANRTHESSENKEKKLSAREKTLAKQQRRAASRRQAIGGKKAADKNLSKKGNSRRGRK